jgi:hypothetical protein
MRLAAGGKREIGDLNALASLSVDDWYELLLASESRYFHSIVSYAKDLTTIDQHGVSISSKIEQIIERIASTSPLDRKKLVRMGFLSSSEKPAD